MKNKTKNAIIILQMIFIATFILYIALERGWTKSLDNGSNDNIVQVDGKTNNSTGEVEKREYIKTYNIIEKLDLSDETGKYNYYVIKEFQVDEPIVIKVDNKYDLEQGKNYEIVFYGVKIDGKTYSQSEIIDNFEIKDIKQTDKTGLGQIQDI